MMIITEVELEAVEDILIEVNNSYLKDSFYDSDIKVVEVMINRLHNYQEMLGEEELRKVQATLLRQMYRSVEK